MPKTTIAPWNLGLPEVLETFATTERGLSSHEAASRAKVYGPNEVAADAPQPGWRIFADQFASPLVLILIGASAISFSLGESTETLIILLMVFLSGLLGFYQEYRSELALRQLRKKLGRQARVLRDGAALRIDARDLVPGDLVELELGAVVPADLRLIALDDLELDESSLTGESVPVGKRADAIGGSRLAPQDRVNMAFMGTHVVQGSGRGIVVATALTTELGKTASLLAKRTDETEFQKGIRGFGSFLLKVTLALCLIVAGVLGLLHGEWTESLLFALALAVGISPELLPVIVTMNLARGALDMSKKAVLVKRLISIEDLGSADVLCTDKTGTLTVGTLRVRESLDPEGKEDPRVLALAARCIDISGDGRATNPVDQAILDAAGRVGGTVYDRVAFDFTRRRMSCVVDDGHGGRSLIVKGATDEVIRQCAGVDPERLIAFADGFHEQGYRLVAVATRSIGTQARYSPADETDLSLKGFILVSDAPKQTAKSALASLAALHVRVVILTGDNEKVTAHVASQLGFAVHGVLKGEDLDALDDASLDKRIEDVNVFAKITPAHKLRVIQALKRRGHAVAFMGDGVNDAPALREADAGISFESAVDVAKEAAGIILLKKKLSVLADGIREGRMTFARTRTYLHATISSNFGNMLSVAGASLLLPFIPLLPAQILLLNLLSDVPMLAIPTDNVGDEDIAMPLRWNLREISDFMYFFGAISSLADYVMFAFFLFVLKASPELFRSAWFMGSMATEILVIFILRSPRLLSSKRPGTPLLVGAAVVLGLTVLITQTSLGEPFSLVPLSPKVIAILAAIVLGYGVLTQAGKLAYYRFIRTSVT